MNRGIGRELERKNAEIARLRSGLQMIATQEYDRGYTPEMFAEAVLSGDEPVPPQDSGNRT